MNPYLAGFIVGLLIVDIAVVAVLLRRMEAQEKRLEELAAIIEDDVEPDYMSATGSWYHGVEDRHAAEQAWQEEQDDAHAA